MMLSEILLLAGALFMLLAAIGLNRFGQVLERMHVMSKATTFGLLLMAAGGIVALDRRSISALVLAAALQLATSPVSSNLMARATYGAEGIPTSVDIVDELAEDNAHRASRPRPHEPLRPSGGNEPDEPPDPAL